MVYRASTTPHESSRSAGCRLAVAGPCSSGAPSSAVRLAQVSRWWAGPGQRPTILVLAALAALLELLDAITSISMMQRLGPSAELNPLVRELFWATGPIGVVLFKIGITALVIPVFVFLGYRRRPALARVSLLIAIGLGSVGVLSNVG